MIKKFPFIDLQAQYLSLKDEIDSAIADVIAKSNFVRGPHVDSFEQNFAKKLGIKHCASLVEMEPTLFTLP